MCEITHQQNSHLDLEQLALEEKNWSSSALPYLFGLSHAMEKDTLIPISDLIVSIELFSIVCQKKSGIALVFFISICDWSRKLVPLFQPIRCKTKTNHDYSHELVARVFPRFSQFGCFYFKFSLAFSFLLSGRCDYFGLSFTTLTRDIHFM